MFRNLSNFEQSPSGRCSLMGRYEGTMRLRVVLFLWWRSRIFVYRKLVHPTRCATSHFLINRSHTSSQITRLHVLCPRRQTIFQHQSKHEQILTEVRMEGTISTEDLKAKLDRKDPITVVETLAPERYREAHLPGALNIPPERIKELAPQLLPSKDAEIVTYCTSLH